MTAVCEIVIQDAAGAGRALVERLEAWLVPVVASLAPEADSFAARLATESEVRRENAARRGKDRPTDVLSFAGGETPEGRHLGDVLIALPTARRQAARLEHSLERELQELLLHGILHCLGHDHETDDGEMVELELALRREWVEDD